MDLGIRHVEVLAQLGRMARIGGRARLRPERLRWADELVASHLATYRVWRGRGAPECGREYRIAPAGAVVLRAAQIGLHAGRRLDRALSCACAALAGGDETAWEELAAALG